MLLFDFFLVIVRFGFFILSEKSYLILTKGLHERCLVAGGSFFSKFGVRKLLD
jgi:hypothetical protein